MISTTLLTIIICVCVTLGPMAIATIRAIQGGWDGFNTLLVFIGLLGAVISIIIILVGQALNQVDVYPQGTMVWYPAPDPTPTSR